MSWFEEKKSPGIKTVKPEIPNRNAKVSKVPEGLWVKCPHCGEIIQSKNLRENAKVCTECNYHFRMNVQERITLLSDKSPQSKRNGGEFSHTMFEEYGCELRPTNPLEFKDIKPYEERLRKAEEKTGCQEAIIVGKTKLTGVPYHLGVFEFAFMGGSMGVVVGEKICLLLETAIEEKLPAVIITASGGARMQEGILSLMQMAKTSALIQEMKDLGLPYITVLTDPTTGGVAASFAMLGDVILAEPRALIGFAGPRVIEQTIRKKLPKGFQRSEFLLKHGFVDRIVERNTLAFELREWMLRLGRHTCSFPERI